jgi:prepilin-type N-terminal cleavage/methylation domain-containing protein
MSSPSGFSAVELLAAVVLLSLALAVALPRLARMRSESRTAAAARQVALDFRELRWRSVSRGRALGWQFREDAAGPYWVEVRDGNGNGLRSAEIRAGIDTVSSPPRRLEHRFERVRPGFPPLARVPRIPPATGALDRLDDPVRFGRGDLISFAPSGSSSSGTLYLSDGAALYAVVLFGPTSRTRVWRYDAGAARWAPR